MSTKWKMQEFKYSTSSKPLQISIILIFGALFLGFLFSFYFKISQTVLSDGEIISDEGEKVFFSLNDGTADEITLKVGDAVQPGQVLVKLKIPYEKSEHLAETLDRLGHFADKVAKSELSPLVWPDLNSENPTVLGFLSEATNAWHNYIVAVDEYNKSLPGNSKSFNTKNSKLNSSRNEAYLQLKHCYLKILDYYESHFIRATTKGFVAKISVTSYQQVQKGQILFSILPDPTNLAVRLKIPTSKIAQIPSDASVQLAVDSFPYQHYGYFFGKVKSIDQITVQNDYTFEVKTTIQEPTRLPANEIRLLPGMKVRAYIRTKEQTLIQMIYERIFLNEFN